MPNPTPGLCASADRGFRGAAASGVRLTIASIRVANHGVRLRTTLDFPDRARFLLGYRETMFPISLKRERRKSHLGRLAET